MKRFLLYILCAMFFALCAPESEAANKFWWASCRTGGGDCLDGIDGANLTAGDGALVVLDSGSTTPEIYFYRVYASSASESDPLVIAPDSNPGTLRWHLVNIYGIGDKINNIGTFGSPITSNPYALTAANSYGPILWYGATGEIDLPAAVAGMSIIIYNTGAFTITIDPNGTDVIVRDGTAQSAGVSITLSSDAGNYVTLVADTANHWVTLGYKGILGQGS